jgi:hypothetical protein
MCLSLDLNAHIIVQTRNLHTRQKRLVVGAPLLQISNYVTDSIQEAGLIILGNINAHFVHLIPAFAACFL